MRMETWQAKNVCTIGVVCAGVSLYACIVGFLIPWAYMSLGKPIVSQVAPIYPIGIVSGGLLLAGLLMYWFTRKA